MNQTTTTTATTETESSPPSRRTRIIRRLAIALAVLAVAFYGGIGWIFSSKIQNDAFVVDAPSDPEYDVEVLDISPDRITLSLESGNAHLDEPGVRGVAWQGGYGRMGDIIAIDNDRVTRAYLTAEAPAAETMTDVDGFAYASDPLAAHGLEFEEVTYRSEVGDIGAWLVPGDGDRWAILVHGKGSPRREALRMLPVLHDAGFHALVIDYRNDEAAPRDPGDVYGYGTTEWRDVEGAVEFTRQRGADTITLVGYSMGGGIVSNFMIRSELANTIDAVILDSPMLDFSETVDLGADNTSLPLIGLPVPQSLTNVAKVLASWRFGVDWPEMDYLDDLADPAVYSTPTLIFHGTDDQRVPLSTSKQFAEDRPDIVELLVFEDAGHVLSWNLDPDRYETALRAFIARASG